MKGVDMKDKEFKKLQDEAIELVKNKKGNKNMKAPKEVKTYTLKQIIKSTVIILALLSAGAFGGIMTEKAIANTINQQVKEQTAKQLEQTAEQVKSFTTAVEVKK
jgi:hypothetical protein